MNYVKIVLLSLILVNYAYLMDMVINAPVASLRTTPKNYTIGQEHDEKESRDMFGPSYALFMSKLTPELRDPQQDTQLLYNERVRCLEELDNGFLKVELLEQYGYNGSKKCFEHVIGYIKKEQAIPLQDLSPINMVVSAPWTTITTPDNKILTVPMGTKLHGTPKNQTQYHVNLPNGRQGIIAYADVYPMSKKLEPEDALRTLVVTQAKQLVGGSYNWGGRCPQTQKQIIHPDFAPSYDCSGLTNACYRMAGLEIARNAQPQWLRSAQVDKGEDLRPGDLIFFARPTRKDHVHHVMMYLGNNHIVESCILQGIIIQKTEDRFGKPLAELTNGDTIKTLGTQGSTPAEYIIYFGSYLHDKRRMRHMRDYALGNFNVKQWVPDEQTPRN